MKTSTLLSRLVGRPGLPSQPVPPMGAEETTNESYETTRVSDRRGLGTLIDLPAARGELRRARFVTLAAKPQRLDASAALAFTTGESPQDQQPSR